MFFSPLLSSSFSFFDETNENVGWLVGSALAFPSTNATIEARAVAKPVASPSKAPASLLEGLLLLRPMVVVLEVQVPDQDADQLDQVDLGALAATATVHPNSTALAAPAAAATASTGGSVRWRHSGGL
ncbi:hypothetical protein HDU97_007809 [Phlyctochytrium planicorne]|nr:hypothetical protein HDU97_007809 [Phlyctochytrium planicorne]